MRENAVRKGNAEDALRILGHAKRKRRDNRRMAYAEIERRQLFSRYRAKEEPRVEKKSERALDANDLSPVY